MRANLAVLCLSTLAATTVCQAQTTATPASTDYSKVYCAGFVSDQKIPTDTYLISGEQSNVKIVFAQGDYVFINRGQDKGVKVGDKFMVVRPESDPDQVEWFKGQTKLMKAMGTLYRDAGHLRVVSVHPKTSVAQVDFSCDYIQRGDVVRPFEDRPAPPYKDSSDFDHFAPVSGKPVGMMVAAHDFAQGLGKGNTVYVNLGVTQGAKVGDYVRIFRYQGTRSETAVQTKNYQYQIYGFGSSPARYEWKDLPREVLGEGIVLNSSRNAATVLLTYTSAEVYTGDYVEIE
jgi:hypothetical protein